MIDDDDDDAFRAKYRALSGLLDERSFRLCLAGDATALGRGGISQVARASGVSRTTIHAGMREVREQAAAPSPEPASQARHVAFAALVDALYCQERVVYAKRPFGEARHLFE